MVSPSQRCLRDRQKREALLHQIQQKVYDKARFTPIWELAFLCATGLRVAVSGLNLIKTFAYSAPYEDVQLKSAWIGCRHPRLVQQIYSKIAAKYQVWHTQSG